MPTPPPRRTQVMGILNVTPDSFSDGGQFHDSEKAVEHGLKMIADGADILDLGAESTRPGSLGTPAPEQLTRLLPVLRKLRKKSTIPISIDTRSAAVAAACLDAGANVINDISALRDDPGMLPLLARKTDCDIVLMHMLGTPATMQQNPVYSDVIAEILAFFNERLDACASAGIKRSRIWLDPGFGFGKTFEHNLEIVRRFAAFSVLKCPLVAGISRKGFLGRLSGRKSAVDRDSASIAAGLFLTQQGASILRVHDVAGHVAALRTFEALNADTSRPVENGHGYGY